MSDFKVIIPEGCDKLVALVRMILSNKENDFARADVRKFIESNSNAINKQLSKVGPQTIRFIQELVRLCGNDLALKLRDEKVFEVCEFEELKSLCFHLQEKNEVEVKRIFDKKKKVILKQLCEINSIEAFKIKNEIEMVCPNLEGELEEIFE